MQSTVVPARPAPAAWLRTHYFPIVSGFLLFLTLWSFSDNLVSNVGQPSNRDPKFIVHGLFCLAWMAAFFAQATLVRRGDVAAHRRLGVYGFVAALGVMLSTVYVFVAVWKGWDAMAPHVKANRLLLPSSALLLAFAWRERRRPEWHRRAVLVATLYMLEPILGRAFGPLDSLMEGIPESTVDAWWMTFFLTTWGGLFASLHAYDAVTARRIHPVTLVGTVWFAAIWAFVSIA